MTDAELAILSIIAEAPIAGFGVQSVIEERNLRMWTMVGVESTYYIIEKLERQGLVTNIDTQASQDVKDRTYRITPAGTGVLQTAVTDLLSSPRYVPQGFDIGLVNLSVLQTRQVHNALLAYRSGLHARLEALQHQLADLEANAALPFHIFSMFQHQIALLRAEIAWFDEWFPQWQAQAPEAANDPEVIEPPYTSPRMQQVILPHDPDSVHKSPTHQRHIAEDQPNDVVEYPPPPQPRNHQDRTQINQDTPPSFLIDDSPEE
ncbi:MAG: PadR family transcriptional regulator [Anaerolineales bacterium]